VGVIGATIGLYYYLKIVREMYWQEPTRQAAPIVLGLGSKLLIITLSASLIIFGIWQIPLSQFISHVLVK